MTYIKLKNNIVIQKQPYLEKGFVEAPDDVICGQIKQANGSFKNPTPIPPPPPTKEELLAKTTRPGGLADRLEEIIDFIENGTPLSVETKTWVSNRKGIRED